MDINEENAMEAIVIISRFEFVC